MTKRLKNKKFINTLVVRLLVMLFIPFLCSAQEEKSPNVTITTNTTPPAISEQEMTIPQTETTTMPNIQPTNKPTTPIKTPLSTPEPSVKPKEADQFSDSSKEEANIFLNFENATLASVVNYLAEQKKINIIPREELNTINVTLTTRNPMTLDRAWDVLLTLLEMNNFTIIDVDGLYRIVPSAESKTEPIPSYSSGTGTEPEDLPDSDLVVRYIYFLNHIKADTVQNFLSSMLEGDIQTNKDLEACIITAKCLDIKAAMKIIKELDLGGLREAIKVIPLKYTDAQDISKLFEELIPKEDKKGSIRFIGPITQKPSTFFSSDTKIFPETRKNSLILLGTEKNLQKIIDFIYKYLDIPMKEAGSRLHIKEIKHAKAESLKPILENIIKPPTGVEKSLVVGEYKFFEDVIVAADSGAGDSSQGGGNRLIIASNKEDWERLDKFIDLLDKPQPQVALEVMIVDVGINTEKELGAQFKKKPGGGLGGGINTRFMNLSSINIKSGNGEAEEESTDFSQLLTQKNLGESNSTFITAGTGSDMWAVVRSILSVDNFNIISQPFMVVNNYQKCTIDTHITRRVPGSFSDPAAGSTRTVKTDDIKAGIVANITPKINSNGIVELDLDIKVDEFQQDTADSDKPATTDRTLQTKVRMATGEVLVLGGLTRSTLREYRYKTPILGDIPLLGNLFKSKSKEKEKKNLYIFIRPSIIKPRFDEVPDNYTLLKLDYSKYQLLNVDSYVSDKDPIQRWFFKPRHQSAKQKISDASKGVFRPIDNYTYGLNQPNSVNIGHDPYFRASETLRDVKTITPGEKEEAPTFNKTKTPTLKEETTKPKERQFRELSVMPEAPMKILEEKTNKGKKEEFKTLLKSHPLPTTYSSKKKKKEKRKSLSDLKSRRSRI